MPAFRYKEVNQLNQHVALLGQSASIIFEKVGFLAQQGGFAFSKCWAPNMLTPVKHGDFLTKIYSRTLDEGGVSKTAN